jgi:hypothetical protein
MASCIGTVLGRRDGVIARPRAAAAPEVGRCTLSWRRAGSAVWRCAKTAITVTAYRPAVLQASARGYLPGSEDPARKLGFGVVKYQDVCQPVVVQESKWSSVATVADALSHAYRAGVSVDLD